MSYEDELEALQEEAMAELEGETNDTDTDDNQREESTGDTDNDGEAEDDGEHTEEDENEDDYEDGEELDEDEEDEDDEDNDDDSSDDSDNDSSENNDDFEPIEVFVNNQSITLNSLDELKKFVKNGSKSKVVRNRKSENDQIIEQGGLSKSDLALLIDAKNGNKAAISKLAKDSGVDIFDIDDNAAEGYKQEFQAQIATEVDNVASDIMEDTQLHDEFKKVVSGVPQDFAQSIATDAKALRHFADHVKSGLAQKVIPEAIKAQMLQGGTFMENYARIGRAMSEETKDPTKSKTKRKENPRAKKLRERAKNHKGSNKGTKTKVTGDDVWNMSSEDFNKKYM